jgi:hypothetical protein
MGESLDHELIGGAADLQLSTVGGVACRAEQDQIGSLVAATVLAVDHV